MFDPTTSLLAIVVRVTLIYLGMIVLLRFSGKRELGQLSPQCRGDAVGHLGQPVARLPLLVLLEILDRPPAGPPEAREKEQHGAQEQHQQVPGRAKPLLK